MQQNHERFMRMALEEAAKAGAEGNMAVGSVIVRGDAMVAPGRNLVTTTVDPTAHAETVALREAAKAAGDVDLSGCVLYTTFEPCPMCCGAIMVSGIQTLVLGARHPSGQGRFGSYTVEKLIELSGWGDKLQVVTGILPQDGVQIRQEWDAKG